MKIYTTALLLGSALVSGCSTVGGGNLSLGFQKTDSLTHVPSSSAQVVPTLQWKMALNGPKKTKLDENALNASETESQSAEDTLLWTIIGVAAGYYLVTELTKEEDCPRPVTVVPPGFVGTITTTTRC